MTKNNKIQNITPKEWKEKKIKDLLDYERPDQYIVKNTVYKNHGTPVLTANKSFVLGHTNEDFGVFEDLPVIIFDDFTTNSKYVDFPFKIKSSAIKILKPKNKDVNIKFVYEKMKSIKFPVGNHKRYYISQYQDLDVIVPQKSEQDKIAKILSTVDEDIGKTDRIIEKTEKLKKGLMQDLLTRGIGHKKFKKTKLGEIPEEWEAIRIKDSEIKLIDGDRGVNYPKIYDFLELSTGGYCLFLSNKNIKDDKFVFSELQFISRDKDESLRAGRLEKKDVVLTTRGTVGNVAFYYNDMVFSRINAIRINSGMLILRSSDGIEPIYLYHLMKSCLMKRKYKEIVSGSAQPQLPVKSLEQVFIPIPPEDEQKQIADILSTVDDKIEINKNIKIKLTQLKKGLMQDLLSGTKRVTL